MSTPMSFAGSRAPPVTLPYHRTRTTFEAGELAGQSATLHPCVADVTVTGIRTVGMH